MDTMDIEQLIGWDSLFQEEEKLVRGSVRRFVRDRCMPRIVADYDAGRFATELIPELAKLGLLGANLEGYGCAGMGSVAYGLACHELEACDSGLRSFVSGHIPHKLSMRASVTGALYLDEVKLGEDSRLPEAAGLKAPLSCLDNARFGVAFGVLGAARACLEQAVAYTRERIQFGVPVASKQLVQAELAAVPAEGGKAPLPPLHYARLKEPGKLHPVQPS